MKQIDKYTAVEIQESEKYGFSLVEGWTNKDGDFKPNFIKKEIGGKDNKREVTVPLNIKLGQDRAKAIEVALWIYKELAGEEPPF